MKKVILSLGILLLSASVTMAQHKKNKNASSENAQTITTNTSTTKPAEPAAAPSNLKADDMAFTDATHDFGTVQEGPDAVTEFTFKNNGKEPIIIQKAQPSCGCTVPSFSNAPV